MRLYGYFRSSAAYRVRIALNLKDQPYESVPVNLAEGAQNKAPYKALNPQGRVPAFDGPDGLIIQSPAILDYIEDRWPEPPLMPADLATRAFARSCCALIGCDIHPLNNLAVLKYLKTELGADQAAVDRWYKHWITQGFTALETLLAPRAGPFALGESVSMVDLYLVPQLFNARRFDTPLEAFPTLTAIETACLALDAFARARPEVQEDAPA